jgi:hypothetical protein
MDIKSLPSPWRLDLRIASFKNATFHCESNSRESGRRIVEHEFPKKELPYAEDMGHRAQLFVIRGYCITYVRDVEGQGSPMSATSRAKASSSFVATIASRAISCVARSIARAPACCNCRLKRANGSFARNIV